MDVQLNFNCNGRVNINDWKLEKESLFLNAEIENVLYPPNEYCLGSINVELFDRPMSGTSVILNLGHLVKCMEMQLRLISRYEKQTPLFTSESTTNIDFYYIRRVVCQFLVYLRVYLNNIQWNLEPFKYVNPSIGDDFNSLFIAFKKFLKRLRNIPDSTFNYAPSNVGNKSTQSEFHMYHMHLEVRWHTIMLMYARCIYLQQSSEISADEIESFYESIIKDLVYISIKIFDRTMLIDLRIKSPFNCTCIRELWLMLQIFIDTLSERRKTKPFWECINDCINTFLNNCNAEEQPVVSSETDNSIPVCQNPEVFSLWLLYHLSLLYGYTIDGIYLETNCSRVRPNYEQVEKILKRYLTKGGKEGDRDDIDQELSTMIPMISVLVIHWWQPRASIISLLWDCFHKRLDVPFLLQTSGPWTISLEKKSAADILQQVQNRVGNIECVSESCYAMFLRLLGTFLKKNYSPTEVKYWNQIKGRIYSKFSKDKVQEFSASGLYNFISLFLTLAITTDTTNVCSVMLNLIPPVKVYNATNSKQHIIIWKGKLAILLLYSDLKLNLESIANEFIETVNAISCRKDETARSMMTNFVDVFNAILSSSTTFELGEHLFLGGWVDRYLLECSKRLSVALIRVLVNIFERCIALNKSSPSSDGVSKMLDSIWCYVACRVRQLVFDPVFTSEHYQDLSKLAVLFTLEAVRDPAIAKKHRHSVMSLFNHFASSVIIKDIRITRCFLSLVLSQEESARNLKAEIKNFDIILIQSWVKCSILGHDQNREEIRPLQEYLAKLPEVKQILITEQDINEFRYGNESIILFIMCAMKRRNMFQTEQNRTEYDARWRQYFNHIEKWILVSVNDETKETELSFWIYRCIGTLILCTAPMLYVKNQPNNILKTLLNKTVLTTDESSQLYIKSLGKKIFSMIILGIETLNTKADISLQTLLRDLFYQYLPQLIIPVHDTSNNFKVSDILLKCFRDAKTDFVRHIFEMIMSNFFTITIDNTMHKHSYLIMVLLQHLIKGDKTYPSYITEFIITICSPPIFWCFMKVHDHHPHKIHTVDFINNVRCSSHYQQLTIREKFYNAISGVIMKSLTVYQQRSFELLRCIVKTDLDIIKKLSPGIEGVIKDLEMYRRPNAASLRYSWRELQGSIRNGGKVV